MAQQYGSRSVDRWQWVVMGLVAILTVVLVWWFMVGRGHEDAPLDDTPIPEPQPAKVASAASSSDDTATEFVGNNEPVIGASDNANAVLEVTEEVPESPDTEVLSLASSDETILQQLSTDQPDLVPLLASQHMVRKFVRAVNALDNGELVNQYRPFVAPQQPFATDLQEEAQEKPQWQLSEENFKRYEPYVNTLEQMGAERLVALYKQYRPLIDDAFNELGTEKGNFESTLVGALTQLLDTPEPSGDLMLERPSVFYKYQDKELENLPEAQKLLLRMGPQNRKKIKQLSREIMALL